MKKEYMKPQMEAIEIKSQCQILAGSLTSISSDVFDDTITGSSDSALSPEYGDEIDWE